MCHSTLAIYCFIDDFLKASGHREDIRIEVSEAEVITIAITAMLDFGGNFEKSRLILHELGFIKRLLSRSRFSRRVNRLADLIYRLFHQLGAVLKQLHWESRYLLDSFPVSVCDNIRIKSCRLVRDELYRGRMTSKRRYFYGVRVQLLATSDGIPLEFCILPGGCRVWRNSPLICPLTLSCLLMLVTIFMSGKIICATAKNFSCKFRVKPTRKDRASRGWKSTNR